MALAVDSQQRNSKPGRLLRKAPYREFLPPVHRCRLTGLVRVRFAWILREVFPCQNVEIATSKVFPRRPNTYQYLYSQLPRHRPAQWSQ